MQVQYAGSVYTTPYEEATQKRRLYLVRILCVLTVTVSIIFSTCALVMTFHQLQEAKEFTDNDRIREVKPFVIENFTKVTNSEAQQTARHKEKQKLMALYKQENSTEPVLNATSLQPKAHHQSTPTLNTKSTSAGNIDAASSTTEVSRYPQSNTAMEKSIASLKLKLSIMFRMLNGYSSTNSTGKRNFIADKYM